MPIRKYIDAFMAKLGYVRAPAKMVASTIPLTIEVDSTQIKETLELLEQLGVAAAAAESAVDSLGKQPCSLSVAALLVKTNELLVTLCRHADDTSAREDALASGRGTSFLKRSADRMPPKPTPKIPEYEPVIGTGCPPEAASATP